MSRTLSDHTANTVLKEFQKEIIANYNEGIKYYNEAALRFKRRENRKETSEDRDAFMNCLEKLYQAYEKAHKYYIFRYCYEEYFKKNRIDDKLYKFLLFVSSGTNFINKKDTAIKETAENLGIRHEHFSIADLNMLLAYFGDPCLFVEVKKEVTGGKIKVKSKRINVRILSDTVVSTRLIMENSHYHNNKKHTGINPFKGVKKSPLAICNEVIPHIKRFVLEYVGSNLQIIAEEAITVSSSFESIWKAFDGFTKESRHKFILVTDKLKDMNDANIKALLNINWAFIIDLDTNSQEEGLYQKYVTINGTQPQILLPTENKYADFEIIQFPYWAFVNGTTRQPESVHTDGGGFRRSTRNLFDMLVDFRTRVSSPVKVLVLEQENFPNNAAEILTQLFDAYTNYGEEEARIEIISLKEHPQYRDKAFWDKSSFYDVNAAAFCEGCLLYAGQKDSDKHTKTVQLKDRPHPVNLLDYAGIDIIYKDIQKDEEDEERKVNEKLFYLSEEPLSWYGVQHEFAVEPSSFRTMVNGLAANWGGVDMSLKIIVHKPGAGGTTVLRMLAYEFSKRQPTILIRQYAEGNTYKQIEKLFNDCDNCPIFVCIDSIDLSIEECRKLKVELDSHMISTICVYTHRDGIVINYPNEEIVMDLISMPSPMALQMRNKLDEHMDKDIPNRCRRLEEIDYIVNVENREEDRVPLIMSLYAFEEDFKGTKSYVAEFLRHLEPAQKDILCYIAIADVYAGDIFDENLFPVFADTNASYAIQRLLTIVSKETGRYVKLRHYQFSLEILSQVLVPEGLNRVNLNDSVYLSALSKKICKFIVDSNIKFTWDNTSKMKLLKNLFIQKNESYEADEKFEYVKSENRKRFSNLIEKIRNSAEERIVTGLLEPIFQALINTYPDEPHFHAHYGRYFMIVCKDYENAVNYANKAISLVKKRKEDDIYIYHIAGTCEKAQIEDWIKDSKKRGDSYADYYENLILATAKSASENFKASRKNKNEAGYYSDIYMCITLVDFAKRIHKSDILEISKGERTELKPYLEYYDRALSLYDELKNSPRFSRSRVYDDSETNTKNEQKNKQQRLDGDMIKLTEGLEKTLEYWKGLISFTNNDPFAQGNRRQCVRAAIELGYDKMSQNDLVLYIELMEKNMDTDPFDGSALHKWFNLCRNNKYEHPSTLLHRMNVALIRWMDANPNSIDILFYRHIVLSLQALESDSNAEAALKSVEEQLDKMAEQYMGSRTPQYIISTEGSGITSISIASNKNSEDVKWLGKCREFLGVIESKSFKDHSARILCRGMRIFFNPKRQKQIYETDMGKDVKFKFFYSLSGPRALYNEVKPEGKKQEQTTE